VTRCSPCKLNTNTFVPSTDSSLTSLYHRFFIPSQAPTSVRKLMPTQRPWPPGGDSVFCSGKLSSGLFAIGSPPPFSPPSPNLRFFVSQAPFDYFVRSSHRSLFIALFYLGFRWRFPLTSPLPLPRSFFPPFLLFFATLSLYAISCILHPIRESHLFAF